MFLINRITKLWMQLEHRDAVFCLSFLWVLIHSILSKILLDSRVHYNFTFVLLIQSFPFLNFQFMDPFENISIEIDVTKLLS